VFFLNELVGNGIKFERLMYEISRDISIRNSSSLSGYEWKEERCECITILRFEEDTIVFSSDTR